MEEEDRPNKKCRTFKPTKMEELTEMDLSQLNSDISFNILSRLPIDILHRLIIVSKGWQKLITDPDFIKVQKMKGVPVSLSGFFFQERFEYSNVDSDKLCYISMHTTDTKIYQNVLAFLPEKVVLLASSNGLLCCRSCGLSSNPTIYICNPVNKEWITVKWVKVTRDDHIAFDFDGTKGYKLVKVVEVDDWSPGNEESYFTFEVYNWGTEKWVKSKEVCYCDDPLCTTKKLFSKGILYWLTESKEILSYDVENNLSLIVSPPLPITFWPDGIGYCWEICLGESDDELHCVMVSEESILVWVLVDRFSSKWDVKASIPLIMLEEENPQYFYAMGENVVRTMFLKDPWVHPLGFKDGVLFLRVSNDCYTIDVHSRKVSWVCNILDLGRNSLVRPIVIPYMMSLANVVNHIPN